MKHLLSSSTLRFYTQAKASISSLVAAFFVFLLLGIGTGSCQMEDSSDYGKTVNKYRYLKDSLFKLSSEASPFLSKDDKVTFMGLKYFDPNPEFVFKASMKPASGQDTITISETKGATRKMVQVGTITFSYQNKPYSLIALSDTTLQGSEEVFLFFFDGTSGKESYGGGRYLDVEVQKDMSNFTLDFNYAYNPYCSYNHDYSCPIPPAENRLPIAITAGEKNYE